jgi:hypothetical protein
MQHADIRRQKNLPNVSIEFFMKIDDVKGGQLMFG